MINLRDRYRGALIGLAVGDALGTTNEFKRNPKPISTIVGGGPFGLSPGQWTDDTSLALCLADSLIECKSFNAKDQVDKYIRWYNEGYNSVRGTCFDIGNQTRKALDHYIATGTSILEQNSTSIEYDDYNSSNGSLMRLVPVVLAYFSNTKNAIFYAGESSKTTHNNIIAIDCCRFFAHLLILALYGKTKNDIMNAEIDYLNLIVNVINNLNLNYNLLKRTQVLNPTGYVIDSLKAALLCFFKTDNFKDGCLMAANLGGDADTVGAIYGQIAGAFYGLSGIPENWVMILSWNDHIIELADNLYKFPN